ncbi:class C sortase [Streptococcus suis]
MERTKKNTKRKIVDTVMGVVLACGIGILSYPFIRNSLNDLMNQQIIQHYQQQANQKSTEEYQQKLAEMEVKNKQFAYQNLSPGFDPFSEEAKKVEDLKTVYEDHVLGVISIPKIQIRLPIFDQTREDFLARGATYLEGTSFPIGGESTHSVISGHRGLTEAKLFTDLPDLVEGDRFYIELKESEIHAYQVDKIQVVDPSDVSSLQIVEGQDYVTLVTCTPYMVNSHRIFG